jgi:phosphate transport system protein
VPPGENHAPAAARDLLFITLVLKIVTDLEWIGGQWAAVANRALELEKKPSLKPYIDLPSVANWSSRHAMTTSS